ncbi:MAG: hypothetical protein DRP79_01010 [Planctomycetota bacterium]|nr:MAG: hypothetical protein DRP79_01010 [Planctomycetota bacterium]
MDFEDVQRIMKEGGVGLPATTDGERAALRPMGGWAWVGGELWCATLDKSAKAADIRKKPYVEYCFNDKAWNHVRISGPTTISTDNADKKKLYGLVPILKQYIDDPESPEYVVLRTRVERIRYIGATETEYTDVAPPKL